ncbi:sel1 repeat family protein [Escherichia coli]|uniref:sel1 repeat family protein n=1 Tax=Escherichia coli TaxID=562 RepID=UPI002FCCD811
MTHRKTKGKWIFLIFIICVFHSNAYEADILNRKGDELGKKYGGESTYSTYDLSKDEKLELESKSVDGDADASFRLYKYYAFVLNDIDEQMRYVERAAFQGNVIAQYSCGIFFSYKNAPYLKYYNLDEAIYWMRLAAGNGHIKAKEELVLLEKIKQQEK